MESMREGGDRDQVEMINVKFKSKPNKLGMWEGGESRLSLAARDANGPMNKIEPDNSVEVSAGSRSDSSEVPAYTKTEAVVKQISRVTTTGGLTNVSIRKNKAQELFE